MHARDAYQASQVVKLSSIFLYSATLKDLYEVLYIYLRIADVPWTWATLYPGDCIFIPAQYIHQVRSSSSLLKIFILLKVQYIHQVSQKILS